MSCLFLLTVVVFGNFADFVPPLTSEWGTFLGQVTPYENAVRKNFGNKTLAKENEYLLGVVRRNTLHISYVSEIVHNKR